MELSKFRRTAESAIVGLTMANGSLDTVLPLIEGMKQELPKIEAEFGPVMAYLNGATPYMIGAILACLTVRAAAAVYNQK